MRVLQYVLVLAVVFVAGTVAAQEAEKPKDEGPRPPWWLAGPGSSAKDRPAVKQETPNPKNEEHQKVVVRPDETRTTEATKPPRTGEVIKPVSRERLVYRLSHAPARDVANVINQVLESERRAKPTSSGDVIVLSDAVSNSLIISGTSDDIHQTVKLVEQLDAEPLMVYVQVVIGLIESREGLSLLAPNPEGPELSCSHAEACELIEQFKKSDAVKILAQPQVMTLDNQPAFIQVGQRVPRVNEMKDGKAASTTLENVGLIVGLTPRITPEKVVLMELDIEKSELGPEDQGIPIGVDAAGNVLRSPKIETMMLQTTVKIPPSRAVIIGGMALQDGDDSGELVFVVTPHVVARKQ